MVSALHANGSAVMTSSGYIRVEFSEILHPSQPPVAHTAILMTVDNWLRLVSAADASIMQAASREESAKPPANQNHSEGD
jgi:hypothetical protein